jgi:hypothetical protein
VLTASRATNPATLTSSPALIGAWGPNRASPQR